MSIRRLTPKDLSAYRAFWAEALMASPRSFLFSAEEVRAMPNKDVARGWRSTSHSARLTTPRALSGL